MLPSTLALVLASALLHALWNALLKREPRTQAATLAVQAIAVVLSTAAALYGPARWYPGPAGLAYSIAAGACEAGYFATLALALEAAPLGLVYSVARGGAVLAVWPFSVLWLGERATALDMAGAGIIAGGLLSAGADPLQPEARRGLGWAGLCAAFIAAYSLCYKRALSLGAEPSALVATSLGVALVINLARGAPGRAQVVSVLRERPLQLRAVGAACFLGFRIFLVALALSGAGAVMTLRNTSVVFAQLMGFILGERPRLRPLVGAGLVTAGAILLGWPK
jgi:drug/metabolite transporter (DMT)-like permease